MIPEERIEAVTHALRAAFGVTEPDQIARITRGNTPSLVYRIVAGGSPYLWKIITRQENPTRHYNCMRVAAESGMAPRVVHTDTENRISITDFVETKPLLVSEARTRLPRLLRRLHSLPRFDRAPFNTTCTFLLHKGAALDAFLQKFYEVFPAHEREEFCARYSELVAVCPLDEENLVSSHNDLFKPDNILFDGERVWLVDWEAAFLNDRYADLAVVANHVVTSADEEIAYLHEYFGTPPDRYQLARFHLMQQLAHLFYTMGLIYMGAKDRQVDWSEPVPEFREYHRRMWAGEVNLGDNGQKIVCGRVHWEQLQQNVRLPRYQEALRIVAERRN